MVIIGIYIIWGNNKRKLTSITSYAVIAGTLCYLFWNVCIVVIH